MQWFVNYAFLVLDCPITVVYALVCEKPLTKEDTDFTVPQNTLLRLVTDKYGVLPVATVDTVAVARDVYLYHLANEYSVHRVNGSAIWISWNYQREYAINHRTVECMLPRIPLRYGHWRAQIEIEFNLFAIPANPSRDEST